MRIRVRVAGWMRKWADRIDHAGAPKATHYSFTFEEREGARFREDGKGCRLWHYGDADYGRAHTEADSEHFQVDWAAMTAKRVGGGQS